MQSSFSLFLFAAISVTLLGGCKNSSYGSYVEARDECANYHKKMMEDPVWKEYFDKGIKNVKVFRDSCKKSNSGDRTLVWGYYDKDNILRVRKRFKY